METEYRLCDMHAKSKPTRISVAHARSNKIAYQLSATRGGSDTTDQYHTGQDGCTRACDVVPLDLRRTQPVAFVLSDNPTIDMDRRSWSWDCTDANLGSGSSAIGLQWTRRYRVQ